MTSVMDPLVDSRSVDGEVPLADRGPRDASVMIIDDEEINIEVVQAYLEDEGFCNFLTTTDSTDAVTMIRSHRPDIVLLDINMPKVSGLDILKTMRTDTNLRQIPAVVLTASTDAETKLKALRLGASDFLGKPVDPSELVLRLDNVLAAKALRDHLKHYSERLEQQVAIRTEELVRSRQEAIHCLARAAEYRDDDTGRHVIRVGRYAAIIATQMGFPKAAVELLEQAAQLHDIGKIGIPDSILHKPGRLEPDEFQIIKDHCEIGQRIIKSTPHEDEMIRKHSSVGSAILSAGSSSPVLKLASVIAESHHEKWDGSGYPFGLRGNDIPVEGRIVAVADVFDALSSERPYKAAFSREKCFTILEEGRGQHFDSRVLDAFFACQEQIIAVQTEYSESTENADRSPEPILN